MSISIDNAVGATYAFIILLLAATALSMRRRKASEIFPLSLTHELKGLAILAIIFSHIGYFLVDDHRFLFPVSILAGVGVNLFLFLSGFGLAVSSLRKEYSIWRFHWQRLLKLFIPFWLVLLAFFALDHFFLNLNYPAAYIIRSFLGWFPRADLFSDLNSPLWYFSFIFFYYLIFPLLFWRRHPWLSALAIFMVTDLIIRQSPALLEDVISLYRVHTLAFPLGILIGGMLFHPNKFRVWIFHKYKKTAKLFSQTNWGVKILNKSADFTWHHRLFNALKQVGEIILIIALLALVSHTAYYSGVGAGPWLEQSISLLTMAAIITLFLLSRIDINLFHLFGFYSYEIYLLHWPILSRYDIFLKIMPAWLAVIAYLFLFLALGWGLKKAAKQIEKIARLHS